MNGKRNLLIHWFSALIILSTGFSTPLFPQKLDQKIAELEKKIAQLEQRVAKLEDMILQLQKNPAKPVAPSPNKWKDKANWRLLKKGMNKSEVEQILGAPPKVVANVHYGDIWYYPDAKGGNASFNIENILTSWSEID
jgi:hypothetical protein